MFAVLLIVLTTGFYLVNTNRNNTSNPPISKLTFLSRQEMMTAYCNQFRNIMAEEKLPIIDCLNVLGSCTHAIFKQIGASKEEVQFFFQQLAETYEPKVAVN
jgi:hypothetical protein